MTNNLNVREEFLKNNPFFSGSAAEPWENKDPDIASLNHAPYEHICALVREKNNYPRRPLAGLIVGEAGAGKTHFLGRLLKYTQQNDIATTFVFVRPLLNPHKAIRYLLSEIAVSLSKTRILEDPDKGTKEEISQFEFLVRKTMQRYREENPQPTFNSFTSYFGKVYKGINPSLLIAIFNYDALKKQSSISAWLSGRIDEDYVSDLESTDREGREDADLEDEARKIIRSLGMLLDYCSMSMIVCFDQLDGMKDLPLIKAFEALVHFLVNETYGILPLACLRDGSWTLLTSSLDPAVVGRLFSNKMFLWGCSVAQAQELIKARIVSRFGENSEDKYQWLMLQLQGKLKENYSPRQVIALANEAILYPAEITPPPEIDIVAFLADTYRRERDKVALDFEAWLPDNERLLKALYAYLSNRPEYDSLHVQNGKYITLTGKYRKSDADEVACAFVINTADHYMRALGAFNSGMDFLLARPKGICYYITDKRCKFKPTWTATLKKKKEFEELNGISLFLEESQAIDWYGLTSLIFKVEAGDVSLPASMGFRTATMEDFARYMKEGFDKDLLQKVAPPPPPPPPFDLEKKIVDILKTSPMLFMTVTILLQNLKNDNIIVARDTLLKFIKDHPDRMSLYGSTDDNLVMLKS
ncbi:MAG: hypothetical protein LBP21_00030 [Synergistaceae bacterium]|jgi:hypothetical protein|nr:hypothetical protein [Synergistaceae bacterium]